MAGNKSNKRKRRNGGAGVVKQAAGLPSPPHETAEPKNLSTIISDEELEITVETLATLTEHPSIIKSKPCKGLRAAVFDFREACTTGVNTASTSCFPTRSN
jgi:hypothetical protein